MNEESCSQRNADTEKDKGFLRFPIISAGLNRYQCPCGSNGIWIHKNYATGLDDADPDWGSYDEEYYFDLNDPCYRKYSIVDKDYRKWEWVLKVLE